MGKYKFTLVSVFIILIAAIPLVLLGKENQKLSMHPTTNTNQASNIAPSPTPQALTSQNADQTFNQTDIQIQSNLNQMDTDINSINQIDTSQDNTSGL